MSHCLDDSRYEETEDRVREHRCVQLSQCQMIVTNNAPCCCNGIDGALSGASVATEGKLSVVQYLGLFLEAEGSKDESAAAIKTALQTPYARTGDYMVAVALVHAKSRGIGAGESQS